MKMNKYTADSQENEIDFRRVFRGYSPIEVDSFIESMLTDIEALKAEASDLQKKLEAANEEIEGYKRAEKVRKDLLTEAKDEYDRIIKDAKSRAAHVIMRTSRQCNRIVADMVSQVEEQKNIYDATKKEILRFRSKLFGEYTDHIRKINAFVEAAGAFETDALNEEDLNGFLTMLREDNTAEENGGEFDVSEDVRNKVEQIKNDAGHMADEIVAEKTKAQFGDAVPNDFADFEENEELDRTFVNISSVEKPAEKEGAGVAPKEQDAQREPDAPRKPDAKEPAEISPSPAEEQINTEEVSDVQPRKTQSTVKDMQEELFEDSPVFSKESGNAETAEGAETEEAGLDGPVISGKPEADEAEQDESFKRALEELEAAVSRADDNSGEFFYTHGKDNDFDEDDGAVSVADVFGSAEGPEDEFEEIWSKTVGNNTDTENKSKPSDGGKEEKSITNGYGFDLPLSVKDDDDDDFYHEDDDEYVSGADGEGTPTAASTASLEVPSIETENDMPSRWRLKKSMSLTDEFDVIKAENDD